ncbi:HAMP domain-containing sensor histidine kinase [Flavobacterium sp. 5]|uniref:sensor histidine kinase n=1 Tax=Flavobacterium sp. 5 TaxID=2035199 RepID=UPI000C2BE7C4|nr:HAMP domain-containing sensor histidine kinase [Flavobacterium sp. 5]PKB18264.1 signal transduction histidine kinase [Flavobacterium sp. 5]
MTKKLLQKTTNQFLLFSAIVLLISGLIFYYITNYFYIEETDEFIENHKKEFVKYQLPTFKISDVSLWNKYNKNEILIPSHRVTKDTYFTKIYYVQIEEEKQPFRELNSPIFIEGKPYTYTVKINIIKNKHLVRSIAKLFFIIIIILMLGILIIVKISSKRLWKPFYDTLQQIQGFELDKNKTPVFISTKIDEFDQLNKSLSKLIEKNISIYKSQREFVENAAHELQTPLALFQTKIDTLLQLELSKEQSSILSSLNNDVSRFNRLNKNLLLLSKIDNGNYLEKNIIILNDFINKHLDFFTEQAKAKNLSIVTEFNTELSITGNSSLTEVLINNLFLNAIRHNVMNGKIIIRIEDNMLTFLNTGQPKLMVIDKLFNRFSKTNPSSQGNGLGLAIIKKITELNQWQINYAFDNNLHVFSIKF